MANFTSGTEPPDLPDLEVPPPNFTAVGKGIADGVSTSGLLTSFFDGLKRLLILVIGTALAAWFKLGGEVGLIIAQGILEAENKNNDTYAKLAAVATEDLLNVTVDPEAFTGRGSRGKRTPVANAIGQEIVKGLFGGISGPGGGPLQPSSDQAEKFLGTMVQFSIEGWLSGWTTELGSLNYLQTFGELDDTLSSALGFGRLSRQVMGPLVETNIRIPLEWKINKAYRPKLLAAGEAVRQFHRGRITREQLFEELARQGLSDDRIEAQINAGSRFVGNDDVEFLVRNNIWTREQAVAYLRDQGYSEDAATTQLEVSRIRRFDALRQKFLDINVAAFAKGDISEIEAREQVQVLQMDPDIVDFTMKVALRERQLRRKDISETDAEKAVKIGLWGMNQFRSHLDTLGYSADDIETRELLLLAEIKSDEDAQKEKAARDKQRADEKAARDKERADRREQLEEERHNKGLSQSEAVRAFVRGLIDETQYTAALERQGIADADQPLLLELALDDRDDYRAQQAERQTASVRLEAQQISLGQMEKAVERGIVSFADYRANLAARGIKPETIDVMEQLLRAVIADNTAAKKRREEIEAELRIKQVSLADLENAVLRGRLSIDTFQTELESRGYPDVDAALLRGLLEDRVDDDTVARQKRKTAEERATSRRISLSDMAIAVRRGIRPISDYRTLLLQFVDNLDDVDTIVKLLDADMADDAAQKKRKAEVDAELASRGISLSDIERAVRLGKAGMDRYRAELTREHIPPADQGIMVAVLLEEVRQAAEAQKKRTEVEAATKAKPAPLAASAMAVKRGIRTIDGYRLDLQLAGYDDAAQALMVSLLKDEVADLDAARSRQRNLQNQGGDKELTRSDMERMVKAGVRPFADYVAYVQENYKDVDDQDALLALLDLDLDKQATVE